MYQPVSVSQCFAVRLVLQNAVLLQEFCLSVCPAIRYMYMLCHKNQKNLLTPTMVVMEHPFCLEF